MDPCSEHDDWLDADDAFAYMYVTSFAIVAISFVKRRLILLLTDFPLTIKNFHFNVVRRLC